MAKGSGTIGDGHLPLRDKVKEELRQRIIEGTYAPGERLIEHQIADELAVSRVPVREAFRTLETEGFVTVVPRRGVMVTLLSRKDVDELFDVREALEVFACRQAALRATPGDLGRMQQALERAGKATASGNLVAAGAANEAFHDEIIRAAHNDMLARTLDPVQGRLHWLIRQTNQLEGLYKEHQRLYEVIASGDPQAAADQALAHVQANRVVALGVLFDQAGNEAAEPAPQPRRARGKRG